MPTLDLHKNKGQALYALKTNWVPTFDFCNNNAHALLLKLGATEQAYDKVAETDNVFAIHRTHGADSDAMTAFFVLFEETLYFLSVVAIGLWFVWISWMPFLDWLAPPASPNLMLESTTTISDTFRRYSTVSTVYMSGPLTILFVFRVYRTFRSELSLQTKKNVTVFLIIVQYSLFVIIRYDHIYGPTHGAFVLVTVLLLVYYHYSVEFMSNLRDSAALRASVRQKKAFVGSIALMFLTAFAALILANEVNESHIVYFCACICEIVGIIFLGALDVIDIRNMRQQTPAETCIARNALQAQACI